MTEEYVEEGNIKVLLTDYSNWLVTTAIPKYFHDDLKSNSTLNINVSTMKKYISKVILVLKNKFPNNCAWEESGRNTRMSRDEFENKFKREQGRLNVDVCQYTKHGIYSKSSPWINAIYDHCMYIIDIEQVNRKPDEQ